MKMKLAICIPHTGVVKTQTVNSLLGLVKNLKCEYYTLLQEGSILHAVRENLVQKALDMKCTHLLFIDTDMVFEKDAFERLLKHKKDIVGVTYNTRKQPSQKILWQSVGKPKGDFYEVEGVPTGFMLINLKVFKKLPHPWFFWEVDSLGQTVTGEDFWFCTRAREKGYEVWVDLSIPVKHVGDYQY